MLAAVTLAGVPGHGNWPRLAHDICCRHCDVILKKKTMIVKIQKRRRKKLGFSYNGTGRIHGAYKHPRVFLVPFRARPNTADNVR